MKKIFKFIVIPVFIMMAFTTPVLSLAQNTINSPTPFTRDEDNGIIPCDFGGFMRLINNIIGFALFYLAIPLAAIMFVYAGVLLVTSGGAEGKSKAKGILLNTVIGLVCAAAAYLVIKMILNILGYQGAWIGF